ncbi:MAG: arginase family protein, partial [Acetobacteraceae bacterium]|nr:arginase family protein [Acetobacteraceae bacterium]
MAYPKWEDIRNSIFVRTRYFPMIDEDIPTFLGLPLATSAADLQQADVVIIGAPYVAGWGEYAGVGKSEWIAGPKRVRQQSIRYASGYVQDFDIDVFEHLRIVDYGDAAIPPEANQKPTVDNILRAQAAVEEKVNHALDAGAIPIVIGQNSPCGSYAIAKPIAERSQGKVGVISLDTHWDATKYDRLTMDPRVAGSASWKHKMFQSHPNISIPNLVEIGERGMLESKEIVREYLRAG